MTNKDKISPLPWYSMGDFIHCKDGYDIIELWGKNSEANAAYIVKSANAYPELVSIVRRFSDDPTWKTLTEARTLLIKLEEI